MADHADRFVPFWVKDPLPSYTLDDLPIWFDPVHADLWTSWLYRDFDQGWWVTCDSFPALAANSLREQVENLEAGNPLNLASLIGPASHLERLYKSEDLNFRYRNLRPYLPFELEHTSLDHEFHLEEFSVAISAEKWVSSRAFRGPRPAGEPGPKWTIKTMPLESHKLYWLAEVSTSASTTLAILETSGRVDLGYSGHVSVWAYDRQEQLYLPVPAISLDHNWPNLPTVLALSRADRRFFQAYRPAQHEPMAMA